MGIKLHAMSFTEFYLPTSFSLHFRIEFVPHVVRMVPQISYIFIQVYLTPLPYLLTPLLFHSQHASCNLTTFQCVAIEFGALQHTFELREVFLIT